MRKRAGIHARMMAFRVDKDADGDNMLDPVNTNSPDTYKATPRPRPLMLVSAYKPLLKSSRPVKKQKLLNLTLFL